MNHPQSREVPRIATICKKQRLASNRTNPLPSSGKGCHSHIRNLILFVHGNEPSLSHHARQKNVPLTIRRVRVGKLGVTVISSRYPLFRAIEAYVSLATNEVLRPLPSHILLPSVDIAR